jgi:SAM-dependent methyltransferase
MECALSTIPDKAAAVGEIARVLRLGGRFAISDVVADPQRLPAGLRGPLASLACVGAALGREGYEALLAEAGLGVSAFESLDEEAARLAERIEDRLRGARVLGFEEVGPAIELVGLAREAIAAGSLGYAIFAGSR